MNNDFFHRHMYPDGNVWKSRVKNTDISFDL